jgi:hypothetical protein
MRLALRDRDRDITKLRDQMQAAVSAERAKVEQAVTAGLDALRRETSAELEAERLAAMALAGDFNRWEATETDD